MIYHGSSDLSDLRDEVQQAISAITTHSTQFDVLVATGLSGVVPASAISFITGIPLAILRKPGEIAHSMPDTWVGPKLFGKRCLWVDDFTGVGNTARRIRDRVAQEGGTVVATYLTRDGRVQPGCGGF